MPNKKIFTMIYVHSNLVKQNELARSYSQATRKLIETDPILNSMFFILNGDDPKIKIHLEHNNAKLKIHPPGFIIMYHDDDLIRLYSPESYNKPSFYDIGFCNEVFKKAYYVYKYLEKQKLVPFRGLTEAPEIKVEIPNIETIDFADICFSARHPSVYINSLK